MEGPRVSVRGLSEHVGEKVTVDGWLYNRRSKGKIHFLMLRDGSGIVQAIMGKNDVDAELFDRCGSLPYETSLSLSGTVGADTRAPGGFELLVSDACVHHAPAEEFPISKQSGHGADFLLSNRHLWLRSRKTHARLRVRDAVIRVIRDFFAEQGFVCVDAPIFTPSACEGTTNLFEVQYFEDTCYLTQSGQLYMEAAAMALGKVYCFGPTFRAEKSKTRRHLTEVWMVEPEVAYANLDDIMLLAEDFVTAIVQYVLNTCQPELEVLERDTSKLEQVVTPFPRESYAEAVEIVREQGVEHEDGDDFGSPAETALSERFDRPVLVHRYPAEVKAFYMKRDPEDQESALCVDMIAPEGVGEIIGGGQREDDLAVLESRIVEHGLPKEPFEWFLDLRRYGSVPHAGFGLGLERTVAWITGTEHVRECIPFPRMLYRIYP
ncbi:MAG: asparagine--tRNA ligase [Planctomycetes bacterium]|nr:asparagine--tRNA ligase [Planctomycetota bacterium]